MELTPFSMEKPPLSQPLLKITDLRKDYRVGATLVSALRGLSFDVQRGEFLALVGPSGSGKTTLLNLIGCIENPTTGTIEFDGENVETLGEAKRCRIRAQKLSFVFQSFNLLPVLTALENVEYPLYEKKITSDERREKSAKALRHVGLKDFIHHRPMQLSGGQRQRVAIARAIVSDPLLVLADEPTANLDHTTGSEILDLMQDINRNNGTTFIFSTHDQKVMERATRRVQLWDGVLK